MAKGQSLQDPFPEYTPERKGACFHIPGKWHQTAGASRLIRPVRGFAEKQR